MNPDINIEGVGAESSSVFTVINYDDDKHISKHAQKYHKIHQNDESHSGISGIGGLSVFTNNKKSGEIGQSSDPSYVIGNES